MILDLNCDLGENEPYGTMERLMRYVTSANIACGGHAGDIASMRSAVRLAKKNQVQIGAHPGLSDRDNFGRIERPISPAELKTLLLQQISALERISRDAGAKLHHVKLHGALYHMVEKKKDLRRAYLEVIREFWPGVIIFSLAGGEVIRDAQRAGIECWAEAFLDRGYSENGLLLPRHHKGAMLNTRQAENRLKQISRQECIVQARTWCIHADSRNAPEIARIARAVLDGCRRD